MKDHNDGFKPQPIVLGDHWLAGTDRSIETLRGRTAIKPDHNWRPYCPAGERQYDTSFDCEGCTTFATTNATKILKRFLFGADDYSDRFLAVASGTTATGNDPH